MARLMLNPYNLLALDEPTNHMDIRSKDVLKQALLKYDGTMVIVSHDRDFLDGLVTKLYEFGDGAVKEHLGGVDDFLRRKKAASFADIEKAMAVINIEKNESSGVVTASESASSQTKKGQDRAAFKEQSRLKNKIAALEKEIAEIEGEIAAVETELSQISERDKIMELTEKYVVLKQKLDAKMNQWAELDV
ncbi:MAG: ABC-F family ATP-binding cassette domain-containing protein, partial [Bacteroidales bacterium]|nr:ABC-F family ATP-binding cassette domain-containing protein [Bacteroidales bacterium]